MPTDELELSSVKGQLHYCGAVLASSGVLVPRYTLGSPLVQPVFLDRCPTENNVFRARKMSIQCARLVYRDQLPSTPIRRLPAKNEVHIASGHLLDDVDAALGEPLSAEPTATRR